MKRVLVVLAFAALASTGGARAARAQSAALYFGNYGDSVAALAPGQATAVPVRLINYSYGSGYYLSAVSFTVFFDPALIEVLGVQAASAYPCSSNIAGDSVTVTTCWNVYGYDNPLVNLTVRLKAGATSGAYLWIRPIVAGYGYCQYYYPYSCFGGNFSSFVSRIAEVCHATAVWGDVDASGTVDSRDALIALSAAVGLPTPGFNLPLGDVDGDGLTNSRDALMILSHAIGLNPGSSTGTDRTGAGIPDVCPGLTAPGETVVYKHDGATAGIYRLDSLATTPAYLAGTNAADQLPRLDASDTAIVFRGQDTLQPYPQIFRMNGAGVGRRRLTPNGYPPRDLPDWSPDGTRIAYLKNGDVFISDSAGGNEAQVGPTPVLTAAVAWTRDGTALTVTTPSGVSTVTPDSAGTATSLFSWSGVAPPLRWSPDGTTLLFMSGGQLYSYNSGPGVMRAANFENGVQGYDWAPQGVVVSTPDRNGIPSLWLLQGGPDGPIVRLTKPPAGEGDTYPSFRRNP